MSKTQAINKAFRQSLEVDEIIHVTYNMDEDEYSLSPDSRYEGDTDNRVTVVSYFGGEAIPA